VNRGSRPPQVLTPLNLGRGDGGPRSLNHLGKIVLSRWSPGQIDGGKDIFHIDLLGIETSGKKVLLGVIGYFQDTPERGDGGAHGVGAAASDKPALLDHACNPEIYALAIHGESSVKPVCQGVPSSSRPAGCFHGVT